MARWIEKATGIEKVWNQRGWDYLEKSKYSWQKPRPKHKKGDHYAQENFNINWPLIVFDILQLTFRTSKCSISDILLKALPDNNYEVCKYKYILQRLLIVISNNRGGNPPSWLKTPL